MTPQKVLFELGAEMHMDAEDAWNLAWWIVAHWTRLHDTTYPIFMPDNVSRRDTTPPDRDCECLPQSGCIAAQQEQTYQESRR